MTSTGNETIQLKPISARVRGEIEEEGKNRPDLEHTVKFTQPNEEIEVVNSPTEAETYPEGGWKAYSVVFGSFLGLVAAFGTLNSIGAIQAYISTHQLKNIQTSTLSWIFSIYMALSFANCVFVGPLFDVRGAMLPMTIGTIFMVGGFFAVANCSRVYQFILALSLCVSTGNALVIAPLIGVLSHWFNINRGRAIGLATTGGSIGGIVVPIMLKSLFTKFGYTWTIRILAFFCLGCMIVSINLCKSRFNRKITKYSRSKGKFEQSLSYLKELFDLKSLKDLKYVFCIVGTFATELSLLSVLTYYSTYAIAQGMSESQSFDLLTIFNAAGVLGRMVPGFLADKVGNFNIMVLMLIGYSLSILLLWVPFGYSFGVLYAFAVICGFFSSSILSLTPVCLSSITPVDQFGQRYGLLYFFVSTGNLFGIPVSAAIIGNGSKRNYQMFAVFCCVFAFVGTFFWYMSRFKSVGTKFNIKI
ncbi:unnamed protein product [Candida verbasci]|uniref:Major facilitator superfamily (MFS) profile domain-containing protein n=1 Tax=Candida verbasci TaxID=1227364 RepID=A0A9W4TSI0_9ASCO|nr:unnamed protein product [Candida verbasci]